MKDVRQLRAAIVRFAFRAAVVAVSVVATLLVAEVIFRVVLSWDGRAYDSQATLRELRQGADFTASFVPGAAAGASTKNPLGILHPYTGAEKKHDTGGVLAYFQAPERGEEFTILVVGGSVAAAFALQEGRELEDLVSKHSSFGGKKVRVLNYAHAAYKAPQQLMRVAYLLSLGHVPDAVLNIDGFNEVAGGAESAAGGTHPAYPSFPVWGLVARDFNRLSAGDMDRLVEMRALRLDARRIRDVAQDYGLHRSALFGRFLVGRMMLVNTDFAALQERFAKRASEPGRVRDGDRQLHGPRFAPDFEAVVGACVLNWYESSLSLDALCDARGIPYLHILQPTLLDDGSKSLSDAERALAPGPGDWAPAVELGYPLLRERGRELLERDVVFVDLSGIFTSTSRTVYRDPCHLTRVGQRILRERVAYALIARLTQR